MPGPPRKPTNLKVLEGNPGKKKLPENEPKPAPIAPTCPAFLSSSAKWEWKRISKELERLGLLTKVDRVALAEYCQAYARWKEAEETIQREGLIIETTNGNKIQHPAVGVAHTTMGLLHKYIQEFGLSPAARTRISVKPEKQENEFASLLEKAHQRRGR